MKRALGINCDCVLNENPLSYVEIIRETGFDSVFVGTGNIDKSEEIKKKADTVGLYVNFIHAPYRGINGMWENDDTRPEVLDEILHTVDVAEASGIPMIVAHVSSGWQAPEICDKGLSRFDFLVNYAEKKGVTVSFENLRRVGNLAYLADRYENRDIVRFCYDTGHEYGYTYYVSFMDIFRERLACTHIHDNFGKFFCEEPDLHLLPFDGDCDFEKVLRSLDKYSYSGPLSLEVFTHRQYENMSGEEFIKTAFERLKKLSQM